MSNERSQELIGRDFSKSSGYYVFWLVQLCIGALVGASVAKGAASLRGGLAVTLLLGTVAIVELIVVNELRDNVRPGSMVGYVIGTMVLGFVLWGICLLFACVGYWLAFWVSARLGIGGWQFGIPTLLAFVAIYAAVAGIGRMM